jgi:hypothetical protein
MRGGDRSTKYAVRNARSYESQRIRIVLITMGCFLMTMTFILSTKPGAVAIDNSNFGEADIFPPPINSKDIELQMTQIREDFQSNSVEPKIETSKEATNFGAVAVDVEAPEDQNRELENARTEIKPAKETKIYGDVDSESQFTMRGDDEPKSDTEKIVFPDTGNMLVDLLRIKISLF